MIATKNKIVEAAREDKGKLDYKYGAKLEELASGKYIDCSSFNQRVFRKFHIELQRSTILQAAKNGIEIAIDKKEAGDLLYYEGDQGHYNKKLFQGRKVCIGHTAIYCGNGTAVHAASGKGVVEEPLEVIERSAGPIVMVKRIIVE